jgi:hypothetical protein
MAIPMQSGPARVGGRTNQQTRRMSDGSQGVGLTHSPLRTGLGGHGRPENTVVNRPAEPDVRHDRRPLEDRDLYKLQ